MIIIYILLTLITLFIYFKNRNSKNNHFLYLYLLGQMLFYFIPYILIVLFGSKTNYFEYYGNTEQFVGIILFMISNSIIVTTFLVSKRMKRGRYTKRIDNKKMYKCLWGVFKFISICSCAFALYWINYIGIFNIGNNMILREKLSLLGPFAILLMFPVGVSSYYWIKIIDGDKSFRIIVKVSLYSFCAFTVAFFRGQRTDIVLIFLIPVLYLYSKKKDIKYLIISCIFILVISMVYLLNFKIGTKDSDLSKIQMLANTISSDLDRNWTYWLSLSKTNLLSNGIMEKSGCGYLYTLLAFIPRNIAPFKGFSTETWFVYYMGTYVNSGWAVNNISQIGWGITISGLTESIINLGLVGVLIYSAIMGWLLERLRYLSNKYHYLSSCIPLLVVLFSGYSFYNILIIYMPIVLTLMVTSVLEARVNYE